MPYRILLIAGLLGSSFTFIGCDDESTPPAESSAPTTADIEPARARVETERRAPEPEPEPRVTVEVTDRGRPGPPRPDEVRVRFGE